MKKLILLTTLTAAGLAIGGCNKSTKTSTTAADTTATTPAATTDTTASSAARSASNDISRAASNAGAALDRGAQRAGDAMSSMAHDVSAKLTEWKLSTSDIQADLAAKRDIVRTKDAAATSPTGNVDRSTLKSAVEGRIKADSQLTNLKLDVNPKAAGEIQLEGKASTADQIGRAIALALDTDGVTKVTSKVRIDDNAVKN